MNTPLKALLWKEWQEQKWKLAVLTGTLVAVPVLLLVFTSVGAHRGMSDLERLIQVVLPSTLVYVFLASIFVGMTVGGGENSRRTMPFLQSLPIPLWQAAAVKFLVAMVILLTPILVVMTLVWLFGLTTVESGAESPIFPTGFATGLLGTTSFFLLTAVSLLVWVTAGGNNRPDEVSAGAIGFLAIAAPWFTYLGIYWVAVKLAGDSYDNLDNYLTNLALLRAVLPGGIGPIGMELRGQASLPPWPWLAAIFSHALVLYWYLMRFGRVASKPKRTPASDWELLRWRGLSQGPWRTQIGAIAWKQYRETGPLALLAAGGVVTLTLILCWFNYREITHRDAVSMLTGLTLLVGFLVTVIAGIGVQLEDQKPKLDRFWRSRPVNLGLWFFVSYFTGILLLVASFGPILLFAHWWSQVSTVIDEFGWRVVTTCVLTYSLSVAAFACLRQPIYAIMLTVAILVGVLLAGGPPPHLVIDISALSIATTLAYLAVKHDWGWQR